ncbi:ATP-binding protein [Desulfoplanes formicivorans]|uniref:Histidine kinase/HSP90-like ATPase domain-containing protein n=1 Tax=Desulfoplanes formicivorans TaxID=1592317 RepID=A0A194AFH9_9BACT|nr:HAMP domain-containing histidine kinase [Desulfoplanes formicivorans]GAU08827.1 hypothetical protein DPF_1544 [Desulfoplanes formicivorans]
MSRTYDEWLHLARTRVLANAGGQIPGMTHNANNFCHVLEMQLELFRGKIHRQPDMPAADLLPKFDRLTQAVNKLAEMLRDNELHSFFMDEEVTMIDVGQFMEWVDRFWTNNLFYKHKIIRDMAIHDSLPTLQLPPFLLTLTVDEALKNAVEACMDKDPGGQHNLGFEMAPLGQGIVCTLTSPTTFPHDLAPFEEHATTRPDHFGLGLPMVKFFADQAGWNLDLTTTGEQTTFRLEIPNQRTEL